MVGTKPGKLRVGIVSANWGAIAHLPAWRLLGDVEVTAICTSRQETAEAAAKQLAVARPFWDFERMCADPDIDVIDAGTNPILREKIVTAALHAGKHVVNQLPFTSSLEAAERLFALQHEKGVVGAAACSVVGLPHLSLMKEMIDEGTIGEVFQVHCAWQMSFFLKILPGFPYTWFGKAGLGVSVTRNQGSHMLHALRHVFGPIASVVGQMQTQLKTWELPSGETMQVETDDTSHALLRFANGGMGTLTTSWTAADSPGFHIDAFGSKGRLRLDALHYPSIASAKLVAAESNFAMQPTGQEVPVPERLCRIDGHVVAADPTDGSGGQRVSLGRLFEGFTRAVRDGGEPPASFARAVEVQRIVEALYASHRRKAWVDLTPGADLG
ncbi:Gfo/Idh/MocA family protein [Polyangium sorediatum]|uniref:Gfo/Idh/MocA family oxidoreductase n=1 Tax=Polyangium sorediatum TaxID=889274 RepID=A0ABT6P6M0_9BACT|nr:Gfo/Idh/MocA family oxidoreductase [Polyangium sorediatum]MDI1436188.1 Gfo/Idh/MocA family oxidoreductase [Polyangium sorediatum]